MTDLDYLTTKDVAAQLHASTRTVSQMARRGEIRAAKVGRGWIFEPDDVRDYVDQRQNKTRARRRRRAA